jgi:predicted ATPase with chaperone activity
MFLGNYIPFFTIYLHEYIRRRARQIACIADQTPVDGRKFCALDESGQAFLLSAMCLVQFLRRICHRVLKLARTIAGLA